MGIVNFILNIYYYVGVFINENPFLFAALFFGISIAIIFKVYGSKPSKSQTAAARKALLERSTRASIYNVAKKNECPNCGAELKAIYAPCEYCGTRSRIEKDGNIVY